MLDELFIAPLREFAFMRYGLAVVLLVGVTSAVLSCLLVVRRQALLGDAIAHAVLLGVVLGWLVAQHAGIFGGALAAGVVTGAAITAIERNSRIKFDAATGIVFTFLFALALAIVSVVKPRGIDLFHVLLGNVLGTGPDELLLTAVSCAAVLGLLALLFRPLALWSFDPVLARASGLSTGVLHHVFTAMLSVTVVASIQAVGLVLVIAMLVTPGATAYLLADRLLRMMAIAAAIGLAGGVAGLYGSYHLDVASGPAMVVVIGLIFFAAFLFAPRRGVLARAWQQSRLRRSAAADDALRAIATAEAEHGEPLSRAELAERLGPAALHALHRLQAEGVVTETDGRLHPTAAGAERGRALVRTHRLIERYLHDVEGVPIDRLHREADRLEHRIGADTVRRMDRELGNPSADPHGHPIPAEHAELRRVAALPLAELAPGRDGRVSMVRDDSDELLRDLLDLGILPEVSVLVLARDGEGPGGEGLLVRIAGRAVPISRALAERVFVLPRPAAV